MTKFYKMKKGSLHLSVIAIGLFAVSCGKPASQDQLVGDYSNRINYKAPTPIGMVSIPPGVMKTGYSDQDISHSLDAEVRNVNMSGFYMDETEITNAQYRQFTNWVRDSIALTTIGEFVDHEDGSQSLNWRYKIRYDDPEVLDELMGLYLDPMQTVSGKRELNTTALVYTHQFFDYELAASNPQDNPMDYVKTVSIPIYPDTLVWMRQFNYSNNEPIARQYNSFQAFDEYPVVGISWHQANAFCNWRTELWKDGRESKGLYFEGSFRLPSETQWEWAARGGRQLSPYPWGGPYTVNQKGCYLANFKPERGNYSADGGLYTVNAKAYWPNDYGLYNMSGNVAEWTSSAYDQSSYNTNIMSDLNPEVHVRTNENDAEWLKLKVVKGGSWRDPYPYLNISNRDYEFADTAKAYIGFRTIYVQTQQSLGQ